MSRTTPATDLDTKKGLPQPLVLGVWTSLGFILAVALATAMFFAGSELTRVDEQHFHIPGHWLFIGLTFAPGLLQLAYVIPLNRLTRRHGHVGVARGLLVGATLVGLVNCVVVLYLLTMPGFD